MSSFKPARTDTYPTATSEEQAHTENILSQHRPLNGQAQPALQKNEHAQYLLRNFIQGFPARFISQDASQPWLYFWTLQSFYALGIALDPQNKQRYVGLVYLRRSCCERVNVELLTRSSLVNTQKVDSEVDLVKRRICYRRMHLSVRWP